MLAEDTRPSVSVSSSLEAAWIAGFIDGEGLLTIIKHLRRDRPTPQYIAYVAVGNTNLQSLARIRKVFGGRTYRRNWDSPPRRSNWSQSYAWRCPNKSLRSFIEIVGPFLRVKERQAGILIEFLTPRTSPIRKNRIGRGGSAPLTDHEIRRREQLRSEIRLLNTKGQFSRRLKQKNRISHSWMVQESVFGTGKYQAVRSSSEAELAWMSGFFDAEGSIAIERQLREHRPSPAFRLMIEVSNTVANPLQPFRRRYGGRLYFTREKRVDSRGLKWADSYGWYCPIVSARLFLTDVGVNLKVKNRQAALALRFIDHLAGRSFSIRKADGTFGNLPSREVEFREAIHARMKHLNRGSKPGLVQGGGD